MTYSLAFDIYGTLINTSGILKSLEKLIGDKAKIFTNTWRNKQLEYSFRRGQMKNYVDFSVCTKQALDFCCLQYKVKLTASQKEQLLWEYRELPVFPDVVAGLQALKKEGHKISAFSNGTSKDIHNLLYYAMFYLPNIKQTSWFLNIILTCITKYAATPSQILE